MENPIVGQTINRYQIVALLGEGGMGSVYKAHDLTLQRDVAIKLMHPQFAHQPDFQERFLQEARTAARLDHPSIVQVHDFGQFKGQLYIVMEFIPGDNLGQILRALRATNQWIPLAEALPLLRLVCLALHYAHQHGVLHRDIKPDNLMLKPESADGLPYRPIITDLGLAKLAEGGLMTQEGTSMGTPAYMSPEQALAQPTDARSDVYSLGILLFELATGRLPFVARSLPEAIRCHTQELPPAPRSIRPELPEALEQVILKALHKDPAQRFPSAADFAKAIEAATPTVTQISEPTTTIGSTVSLFTQLQKSAIQPRGQSIIQDFEREFGPAAGQKTDLIQIMAPDSTSWSYNVTKTSIMVGRDAGSDIQLEDGKVSRQHTRIDKTADEYQIVDLNSTNGTFLDEVQLLPGVPNAWAPEQILRIGRHWLRLVRAKTTAAHQPAGTGGTQVAPPEPVPGRPLAQQAKVSIRVENPQVTVEAGSSVTITAVILNQGETVDHYQVKVEGLRPSWVILDQRSIQLLPGREQRVLITLKPPREPGSRAGQHRFRVIGQALSSDVAQSPEALLTILPYARSTSEMHPELFSTGKSSRITIQNQGNQPETYLVRWRDPGDELAFFPPQAQISVPEGQSVVSEFRIAPRQPHWLGSDKSYAFSAEITSPTGETRAHNGEFVSKPRLTVLGLLAIFGSCLALAACVVLTSSLLWPGNPLLPAGQPERAVSPTEIAVTKPVILPTETSPLPTSPPEPSPTPPPNVANFSGTWLTNFSTIDFTQQGDQVSGIYTWYGDDEERQITGTVTGSVLSGLAGTSTAIELTLSADGASFSGTWGDKDTNQWCGVRFGTLPEGCGFSGHWNTISDFTPASQPTAELEQTGKHLTGTFFNGTTNGIVNGTLGPAGTGSHYSAAGQFTVNDYSDDFRWTLVAFNGEQFQGYWENDEGRHPWCGWRDGSSPPDPCGKFD